MYMSEIPQILSLTWKIKQSSTWVEYKFDFSLYIDSKIRNILDNWWFGKEQIEAFWLDEWFRCVQTYQVV